MQIQFAFTKSKVAKRIFILFFLAAILPVSITGIVTYNYVTNLLTQQKYKHLSLESKSYGMAIFDRILVAESQLNGLGESLIDTNYINFEINQIFQEIDSSNTPLFENIKVYSNNLSFNNSAYKHLLEGNTKITVNNDNDDITINFSRLINTVDTTFLLSGDVNKEYIFGDMDNFAGDDDACVVADGIGLLNCSNSSLNTTTLSNYTKYFNHDIETYTIDIDDKNYIVASWELFLNGSYNAESWIIYYTIPNAVAIASIKSFGNLLIPLLLLSILVVTLISINQISKILVPLEKLSLLTRKIAKRDFKGKVDFNTGDEFQQLGDSFNSMSTELARQFTVMTAMSNLDRAILTTMNKNKVIQAIFKNLEDYLIYNYASVILLDNKNEINGNLYSYSKTDNKIDSVYPVNINDIDIDMLLDHTDSYVRTLERDKLNTFEWLDAVHSNYITTIAVKQDQKTTALIIIGHEYLPQLNKESMEQLSNYTGRVNVALNAIEREERLVKQANFDDLTGLPNRQLLSETFLKMSQKNDNQKVAVLFIDLDRFKVINDSQGHEIGDKLLIEASARIQSCVDDIGFVSRYGGDEFVILYPFTIDSSHITNTANEIISQLSRLFTIHSYEQYIGASIGITVYPQDGRNWDEVLQKADIAMYKAKQKGRGRYLFFSDAMQADILEKASLEADLFHSIENQEVYMVYQPQINIETGDIYGAETLMRWEHSTKGHICPEKFISYAEESGFIVPLGIWAIQAALKQCKDWQLEGHSLSKLSINISPRQLSHENFISEVEMLISDFDIHTTNIEFEITESIFLSDNANILNKLHNLNKLGISISIDDFGKGYSSLSYLKNLPVQTLKIDKLFIDDIHKDKESVAIVKAIIVMAKSLDKTVIAEGIETVEQLNVLKTLGCDIAQGYFISKPKLAKEIMNYSKTAIINLEDFRNNVLGS